MRLGFFQQLAEGTEPIMGLAEPWFSAFEGLFHHGTPDPLFLAAFLQQGLVGADNQVPCFLFFLIDGRSGFSLRRPRLFPAGLTVGCPDARTGRRDQVVIADEFIAIGDKQVGS